MFSKLFRVFRLLIAVLGTAVSGASIAIFLAPAQVPALGIGGLGVLTNEITGLPIGLVIFVVQIPIMILAYHAMPGGWRMISGILFTTFIYSGVIDLIPAVFGEVIFSDDRMLNTLFGGVLLGIGGGLVYRSGYVMGGTYVLALILRRRTGTPMTTTYLYTDALIVVFSALIFGVEGALYGTIVLFLNGLAQDYVMEGPSLVRTVMIVTDQPEAMSEHIMSQFQVGVTRLSAEGMYMRKHHHLLYVTVSRAKASALRDLVSDVDENAFLVIGQGHVAYGGGFKPITSKEKVLLRQASEAV